MRGFKRVLKLLSPHPQTTTTPTTRKFGISENSAS
nr:MAG TPA: Protein of unknown function (DUF3489) [Caudoviricetes sp.]